MAPAQHSLSPAGPDIPQRREFKDLHPKDQQIKQTKKLCIEKNWQCRIHEALPEAIRPRIELKKGAKARVGDPAVPEEVWWNWSVELLKALEELSSMTEGEVAYAQELLVIEVEARQANPKSSQRKILEVLLGDAQKVVDEQRKRLAVMYTTDVMQDEGESMDMQYDHNDYAGGYHTNVGGHQYDTPRLDPPRRSIANSTHDVSDFGQQSFGGSEHDSPRRPPPARMVAEEACETSSTNPRPEASYSRTPGPQHPPGDVIEHLKTTELKARAARLRAEALRVEAEAAQLEATARELREEIARQAK